MDEIRRMQSEREKAFYNLMSLEVFDLLDPKREVKVMLDDIERGKLIENWDTTPVYLQNKRDKHKANKGKVRSHLTTLNALREDGRMYGSKTFKLGKAKKKKAGYFD